MSVDVAEPHLSRSRRISVRVLAALGLVTYCLPFVFVAAEAIGIVTSSPMGSPDDPPPSAEALAGAAAPGEGVHLVGALGVVLLGASGLIALCVKPRSPGAARQVLAAALALLVVVPLVGNPDNVGGQAGAVDPTFLVLVICPLIAALVAGPFRGLRSDAVRPFLAILAAVALPIGAWWAVGQALIQRNTFPPTADPHHQAHWFAMAVFALLVVLVLGGAAVAGDGWRLGATTAGISAIAFGVTSLVAPDAASAVEATWATATIAWGAAGLYATWRDRPAPWIGGGGARPHRDSTGVPEE